MAVYTNDNIAGYIQAMLLSNRNRNGTDQYPTIHSTKGTKPDRLERYRRGDERRRKDSSGQGGHNL